MGKESIDLTLFPGYSAHVSAERNLEEYPLFELKARQRGSSSRVFERVVDGEGGASLKQTWKVIPSGEYGMPGPVDQDVYLAVLRLLEQRGGMPEDGELAFSLYELRKLLGWSDDSGGAYREIRDALVRIQLTGVQSTNAYYSAADEQLISDSFNVWSVHFAQRRKRAGAGTRTTGDRHVLRFHPICIRNYEAQYLKGLDADFFFGLRLPLSKRLYRLVMVARSTSPPPPPTRLPVGASLPFWGRVLCPLSTEACRRTILRTSPVRGSRKLAYLGSKAGQTSYVRTGGFVVVRT